jgi:hypothetical protein
VKRKVKFSSHIRAVKTGATTCNVGDVDKRPLMSEIESIVASMKNLSGPAKREIVAAFADAGLVSGSTVNAVAAVDDGGHYKLTAIDAALKSFSIMTRLELKNTLMREGRLK